MSRRMRWEGHVASMGAMGNLYSKYWSGKVRDYLGDRGSMILKICVKNTVCEGKNWNNVAYDGGLA
jgi:hypothetical protein